MSAFALKIIAMVTMFIDPLCLLYRSIWCRCMEHFKAYRARNWNYTLLDWQNDRTHCFSYILLPDSGGSAVHKKLEALHGASGTACLNF